MAAADDPLAFTIRALGGALWLGLGVWLSLRRKSRPEARLLAAYFCAISVDFIALNLLGLEQPPVAAHVVTVSWAVTVTNLAAIAALLLLLRRYAQAGDANVRTTLALAGGSALVASIGAAMALQTFGVRFLPQDDTALADVLADLSSTITEVVVHALLAAMCYHWARRARSFPEGTGLAWLAASGALFVAVYANVGVHDLGGDTGQFVAALALDVPVVATIVGLARTRPSLGTLANRLSLAVALVASTMLIAAEVAPRDIGDRGIARAISFAGFIVAFSGYALYSSREAPSRVSRGTIVTIALATVFIVAQVAQNFLAAQYGLLMGGVVAGAFLFAAQPIQRALEGRRGEARPHAPAGGDDRARRIYRDAVRHALRDRVMTRAEEMHLTELAEELAIPASEALRLRHEVEDEGARRA